jgi:hypothetical protein
MFYVYFQWVQTLDLPDNLLYCQIRARNNNLANRTQPEIPKVTIELVQTEIPHVAAVVPSSQFPGRLCPS